MLIINQSAIKLTNNPEYYKRSKHIDVRDVASKEEIKIEFVRSKDQFADSQIFVPSPCPRKLFVNYGLV